jgi:hypothetical protein
MTTDLKSAHSYPEQARKSVTLTRQDLMNVDLIRSSPETLASLGAAPSVAEAALLRILLTGAIGRALETVTDVGYTALALSYENSPEERAVRAATRDRRRVREDVEA